MSLELAWPWALAVLPLPLLVARGLPPAPGEGAALRLPFTAALGASLGEQRSGVPRGRLVVGILAWVLLVVAATRPQWVGEPVQLPSAGRDLLLAVDISGSMSTEDMRLGNRVTDRLSAVKAVAGDFIERRRGDRLGLILFGRNAYLQTPLTFDRTTVRTLLNEAVIGLAGKETALGDAIGLAVKKLRDRPEGDRVLILLTDGANTAGEVEPLKATQLAAAEGVRIHTIGVGAEASGLLGRLRGGGDLDEVTLQAVARQTGGRYFRARDLNSLQGIYALLDELEPVPGEAQTFRPLAELYAWPLGAAFLLAALLLVAASLPETLGFRRGRARA